MGACCTRNDAMPTGLQRINTDDSKMDDKRPLIDKGEVSSGTMEGEQIELTEKAMISYILSITSFDLIDAWKKVDMNNKEEIIIEKELQNLFLQIIDHYIEKKTGKRTIESQYTQRADTLSHKLSNHFQKILYNYNYEEGEIMTKDFYLENFAQYLAEPNPGKNIYIKYLHHNTNLYKIT